MAGLWIALSCLFGAVLLHAGFCAFTWRKFTLFDYGIYTNMIWNCGRGEPFRCLLDQSYLATHLSFTLALLGPLFRLWDHPFLLWLLQWLFLAGGAAILAATAFRLRVPALETSAILLFFLAGPYTQQALLSEFHGVSLYFLLVPWLHQALHLHRRGIWLPWLLILGVREDAALLVVPMFLYFAIRDRWRPGYLYAALSVGYLLLATTTLYPLLTGMSLFQRRQGEIGNTLWVRFADPAALRIRLKALFWIGVPVLPFLRGRGWLPLAAFPLLVLLEAEGGAKSRQFALALHYSTPVLACLATALVEASARRCATLRRETAARPRWGAWAAAGWLVLATLVSHRALGFLPGGGRHRVAGMTYVKPHEDGLCDLRAARHIPRKGVLLCPRTLAGFCANRRMIIDWSHYDPRKHRFDILFSELKQLDRGHGGFRALLEDRSFGVTFCDGSRVILQRGADPRWNDPVLALDHRQRRIAPFPQSFLVARPGLAPGALSIPVLHWKGGAREPASPIRAAHPVVLEAGAYDAVFVLASGAPKDGGLRGWGTLQVCRGKPHAVLAEAPIEPWACGPRSLREQRVPFTLSASAAVEGQFIGHRAELWLDHVEFVRRGQNAAP